MKKDVVLKDLLKNCSKTDAFIQFFFDQAADHVELQLHVASRTTTARQDIVERPKLQTLFITVNSPRVETREANSSHENSAFCEAG